MSKSLKEFLYGKNKESQTVEGSLSCQECNEIVSSGQMNEEDLILTYTCSQGHESKVKL